MDTSIHEASRQIRRSRNLVVFTGAGISAESGIPTFRDDDGFWRRYPPDHFATWQGLLSTAMKEPKELADFLHAVIAPIAAAAPNAAHRSIAEAEKHLSVTVVTQNIDNLHQEAGSTVVHAVHGTFFEIVNRSGRNRTAISRRELQEVAAALQKASQKFIVLPRILLALRRLAGMGSRGFYHPDIVLFGDEMAEPAWTEATEAARRCDCMLTVGSSGQVFPAAALPMEAKARGACIINVDLDNGQGDFVLKGRAAEVVPLLLGEAFDTPLR